MTDVSQGALVLYLIGVAFMLMWAMIYRIYPLHDHERRKSARIIFTAPIWPLLVVPALRRLWREAEWGRR